ncbi:polyketide synthase dehydratase domain-containing protein, partial [Kitasatospora sp. NPDC086801]|uniref:polyketide synthase dehydratase domain-containing protein n=1 Tax=Kitasatospora sp. NPDC086801 TaxID=3364066 RepID=UPI00381BA119
MDWPAYFAGSHARHTDLPTYAFQHEHYWQAPDADSGDVSSVGQTPVGHPLLRALVKPAIGGLLFTSRLSLSTQPWLAGHAVQGTVLLPGTAFVEMAIRAGDEVGCGAIEDLTLAAPLILPEHGAVVLQVAVGEDEGGRRSVTVHSHAEDSAGPWLHHATGTLVPQASGQPFELTEWPPAGATLVEAGDAYETLGALGFDYGSVFRGLRAVWRRGDDLFAEVALPVGGAPEAERFGLHPALMDAALHAIVLANPDDEPSLPFSWSDVTLTATGATVLRVRITSSERDTFAIQAADESGQPVLSVGSLLARPIVTEAGQIEPTGAHDDLLRMDWLPLTPVTPADPLRCAVTADADPLVAELEASGHTVTVWPDLAAAAESSMVDVVVVPVTTTGEGSEVDRTHIAVASTLGQIQAVLSDRQFDATKVVFVTRGAIAAGLGDVPGDVVGAAVWGLVRSAQSEEPGRFVLVDVVGAAGAVLADLVASGEPQALVRDGVARVGRLVRVGTGSGLLTPSQPWRLDIAEKGELGNLALVPAGGVVLAEGEVR